MGENERGRGDHLIMSLSEKEVEKVGSCIPWTGGYLEDESRIAEESSGTWKAGSSKEPMEV